MSISTFVRSHAVAAGAILLVAVATTAIAGRMAGQKAATDSSGSNIKRVSLVEVASFRSGTSTISADGVVEAQSQADLKSQVGAPISRINVSIGDSVAAGQVILELENSDIKAQLSQVQGQYGSTRESTIEKIRDAYLKADDAVHTQIDQLILNTVNPRPKFYTYVFDPALGNRIRDNRADLDNVFRAWSASTNGLSATSSDADIQVALSRSQTSLDKITVLLNDMTKVLSDAANVVTSSDLPTVNSMLAIVTSARSSISGAKQSLSSATVGIAQAGVQNLQAQLDKTIIRSPISGKIAALPLRTGEFAGPGTLLATVVGGSGIQVKAYASGEDLSRLKVGAPALIQNTIPGVVTSVAPSVSTVNRKVEINIKISNPSTANLVVGQNVQARIQADRPVASTANPTAYTLPIQDVKIIPGEAYVFTVGADSKAVKHPVTLGPIRGDFLEVTAGLTDDMKIVSPIYEIEEGQELRVE
ncbi:MAG: family efflux transporter subunit [Candidatus Parcubacteria bacterium]|nr:family efflux transporter subunit [Candidatus Parcubacteria bacterium]